jgi:phosphoribosylanthranilate isomerase
VWVKICGITSVEDAELAVECGADAVGVNFVPASPRAVDIATARHIAQTVGARAEVVGVVADVALARLDDLASEVAISMWQLHGHEAPELVRALAPRAYKALRVGAPADAGAFDRYPGDRILADSKREGVLGGSGAPFDWTWVRELARRRDLILAGGLTPENVADAVRAVRPFGVDVASGVEAPGAPRKKDSERVRRFVEAAKRA